MAIQRDSSLSHSTARPPELPRVYLDTRMPAAPAPGARVIVVGPPRPRRADLAMGALAIVAAAAAVLAFRWARHRRPG